MRVLLYKDLNTRRVKAAFAKVRAFLEADDRMRSVNTYGVTDGDAVNGSGAGGIRLGGWQFA